MSASISTISRPESGDGTHVGLIEEEEERRLIDKKKVIDLSIEVIKSFQEKKETLGSHIEKFRGKGSKHSLQISEEMEELVEGCLRYKKMLIFFVTSLLSNFSSSTLREDKDLYFILAFIVFFRFERLCDFVFCLPAEKRPALLALLSLAFSDSLTIPKEVLAENVDEESGGGGPLHQSLLGDWVLTEWEKILDRSFIMRHVLGPLRRKRGECKRLIKKLETLTASSMEKEKEEEKKEIEKKEEKRRQMMTVPVPFSLSESNYRLSQKKEVVDDNNVSLLVLQPSPPPPLPTPLPATVPVPFVLETAQRGENFAVEFEKRKNAIREEKIKECSFSPQIKRISEVDGERNQNDDAGVRYNVSSILREHMLLTDKQKKEYEILQRFLSEMRDSSEFYEWKKRKDDEERLEEKKRVEERKEDTKAAREDAMQSLVLKFESNRMSVVEQKMLLDEKLKERGKDKEEDLEKKKFLVSSIKNENVQGKEKAHRTIRVKRIKNAEALRMLKREDEELKKRMRHAEMEKKKDLILQIRAFEKVSVIHVKPFDLSEPPRLGILGELSVAELRERLSLLRAQHDALVKGKREHIINQRKEKSDELIKKIQEIKEIRNIARLKGSERVVERRAKEKEINEYNGIEHEKFVLAGKMKIIKKQDARELEKQSLMEGNDKISMWAERLEEEEREIDRNREEQNLSGKERSLRKLQNDKFFSDKISMIVSNSEKKSRDQEKVAKFVAYFKK